MLISVEISMKIFQSNDYPSLQFRIYMLYTTHFKMSGLCHLMLLHGLSCSQFLSFPSQEPHHYLSGPDTDRWPYLGDKLVLPYECFHKPEEDWPTLCQRFYPTTWKLQTPPVEGLALGHCVGTKKFNF